MFLPWSDEQMEEESLKVTVTFQVTTLFLEVIVTSFSDEQMVEAIIPCLISIAN